MWYKCVGAAAVRRARPRAVLRACPPFLARPLFLFPRRNPAFEGVEAYVRFYLPESYHVVYAVLGTYAAIGLYFGMKSSAAGTAKLAAAPPPSKPDYHTPLPPPAEGTPDFGTPEWEMWAKKNLA